MEEEFKSLALSHLDDLIFWYNDAIEKGYSNRSLWKCIEDFKSLRKQLEIDFLKIEVKYLKKG
jgi:hypothetical protein